MLGKHSFLDVVRVWTQLIAGGLTLILIVLYQPLRIEGNSMAPLLSDHERIYINRIVYQLEPFQRSDVVVFDYPMDNTKLFIKRIVALPDETCRDPAGLSLRQRKVASEPYVPSQYCDLSDFGPLKLPSDSYFVMGDHRNRSNDSRAFGTVASRLIHGRAVFAYWPVSHFGSLSATASTQAKNK